MPEHEVFLEHTLEVAMHDLLMMTFRLRLKKTSKPKHTRLKFDLEKLKDPNVFGMTGVFLSVPSYD